MKKIKRVTKRLVALGLAVAILLSGVPGMGEVKAYDSGKVKFFGDHYQNRLLAGSNTVGVIANDWRVYMWGRNFISSVETIRNTDCYEPEIPIIASSIPHIRSGTMAPGDNAVVTYEGELYTWGNNSSGMCGFGDGVREYASKVMDNVRSVSMGKFHTLIVTNNNELYGSGWNFDGQLGIGENTKYSKVPVKIMDNVAAACAGLDDSAAITTDGDLYVWGRNQFGQIDDTRKVYTIPTKRTELKDVIEVSIGVHNIAAITKGGDLYVWGKGSLGSIGNGQSNDQYKPVKVMDNIKSVCMGDTNGAAITDTNDLYVWGSNEYGRLGTGKTWGQLKVSAEPTKIMEDVIEVKWSNVSCIALTKDENVWTWGSNIVSQLGNGTRGGDSSVPLNVFNLESGICDGKPYDEVYGPRDFNYNNNEYSQELAEKSALYAMLAYEECGLSDGQYYVKEGKSTTPQLLKNQLFKDGFSSFTIRNYKDDNPHNCSYTIANRKINYNGQEKNQILINIRGTDGVEWDGNMQLTGSEYIPMYKDIHYSFESAKDDLVKAVNLYLWKMKSKGYDTNDCIIWITGHSRGAAVANLLAAELSDKEEAEYGDVFAYTFATANATKDYQLKTYNNIFNHCFEDDFVPSVPLARWEYGNYGNNLSAVAENLYNNNDSFRAGMRSYKAKENKEEASFSYDETYKLIRHVASKWNSVEAYYNKILEIKYFKKGTLYKLFYNIIAKLARQAKGFAIIDALFRVEDYAANPDFRRIITFFMNGVMINSNINDTHQAYTYYLATKLGLFHQPSIGAMNSAISPNASAIPNQQVDNDNNEQSTVSQNMVSQNSISDNNLDDMVVENEKELTPKEEKDRMLQFLKYGENKNNLGWQEDKPETWNDVTFDEEGYITEMDVAYKEVSGSLDVSGFSRLKTLKCEGNAIETLNMNDCSSLEEVSCYYNELTEILLNECMSLKVLDCSGNSLKELNLLECTGLKELNCDSNELENLNLSNQTKLEILFCKSNQLYNVTLPTTNSLWRVNCEYNYLINFDVWKELASVESNWILYENQLPAEDAVFSEQDLQELRKIAQVEQNQQKLGWDMNKPQSFSGVTWSYNNKTFYAKHINLDGMGLEGDIKLENLSELETLSVAGNQISSLEIVKCPNLRAAGCAESGLEEFTITECPKVNELYAERNFLTPEKVEKIAETYPSARAVISLTPQFVKGDKTDFSEAELEAVLAFANLEENAESLLFDAEEPGKWDFISWEKQEDGLYHITGIYLSDKWITGRLDLSDMDYLTEIKCDNTNITEVVLPNNLKELPKRAFYRCNLLEKITIPEKVEVINALTLAECSNLEEVIFKCSNAEINCSAFYKSEAIKKILCYRDSSEAKYLYDSSVQFEYFGER